MKPSTKAFLAVLAVALPALFNFFAAKMASDEAKVRAEVAWTTMQEVIPELQEASYTQALQIARLEGQQKCSGAPSPAPTPKPQLGTTSPRPPALPVAVAPAPDSGRLVADGDGVGDNSNGFGIGDGRLSPPNAPPPPAPHVGKVRPKDFQQAVQDFKAKK